MKLINERICLLIVVFCLQLIFPICVHGEESLKGRQIFSRDQLDAFSARTLTELLNALPGISANGGIKIQGSSSANVVVFINGRRITDPATKANNITGYQAADIDQIEVIKGAGAAIYGDDTAGGVILITTRKGKKGISGTCEVSTNTYRVSKIRTKILQREATSAMGGTLQFTYADQPEEYIDVTSIMLKNLFLEKTLDSGAKWMVNMDGYYGWIQLPGLTYSPTPNAEMKGCEWNLTTTYDKDALKSQTYYTGYGDDYENPDIDFHHKYLSQVLGETLNYSLNLPLIGKTPLGGTFEYHIITSNNFDTEKESQGHLFATKDWDLAEWANMAVGFRLSYYTAFDWGYNPEATLTFPLDKWALKINANQSYNTPSIGNRFYNSTYEKGNPDLDMEQVTNYSLGFTYNPAGCFGFSAGGFYSRIADAVTQVRYGDITTYENLDSTTRKGADASLNIKAIEDVNLNLSYVYLIAKNDDTDLYLVNKPDHTFKYTLTAKYNDFSFMHKGIYTSWYYSNSMNTEKQPGRYLADVRLTYTKKSWQIYLEATNLFDKDYEEYRGKPGYGRNIKVGMQWDF